MEVEQFCLKDSCTFTWSRKNVKAFCLLFFTSGKHGVFGRDLFLRERKFARWLLKKVTL